MCSFDIFFGRRRFEFADGGTVAECGAAVGVVDGAAAASVQSAHTGNAHCDNCHCGLNGGPYCDVDDVV